MSNNTDAQDNAIKKLGKDTVEDMATLSVAELKKLVIDASTRMQKAKDELDANPDYQQIKADKSNFEAAKRDLDAREKARIRYSLEMVNQLEALTGLEQAAAFLSRDRAAIKLRAKRESKS